MCRSLISIILLLLISAIPASASVCDDWNMLEKEIRDSVIGRNGARERIIRLDRELLALYAGKAGQATHHFPVRRYGPESIGGRNGNGYSPAGYDFYDGNRHGGHPAHDLFIRDKKRSGMDSGTGKPAEIVAFADGVVVGVNPLWEPQSRIRGGIYIWVFSPEENRYYYYSHLEKILVTPGDMVRAGDTIALLGRTGRNAWPKRSPTHLHFMCLSFDGGRMTPVNTFRELSTAALD